MKHVGRGLIPDWLDHKKFPATNTKMASNFVHSIELEANGAHIVHLRNSSNQ